MINLNISTKGFVTWIINTKPIKHWSSNAIRIHRVIEPRSSSTKWILNWNGKCVVN